VTPETVTRALSMHDNSSQLISIDNKDYVQLVRKDELITLEELEKRYISYLYKKTGANKSKTAYLLGISERTLYRKMKQYDIDF